MTKIIQTALSELTFNLTELDLENIKDLQKHAALSVSRTLAHAVYLCRQSLEFRAKGMATAISYSTGDSLRTRNISHETLAKKFNAVSPHMKKLPINFYRTAGFLQAVEDIKKTIRTDDDSVAIGYAIAFAHECIRTMKSLPGSTKKIMYHKGEWEGSLSSVSHFNDTFKNKCARLKRKMFG